MYYDFQRFTAIDTGDDSVLYRSGPTGYRLAQAQPLTVGDQRPARSPRKNVVEAKQQLDLIGYPFEFFTADTTGRENVCTTVTTTITA